MTNLLKKLKKKLKGVVIMTPLPKIEEECCQGYVPLDSKIKKASDEAKALLEKKYEEEQFSATPEQITEFEESNPGKHAVWRGYFTKQFKGWVKQYDSKD